MLLYVGVIAVLTPFLLPIFWNDLTRSNWRIFGAIGVVLASLLVGASIIVTSPNKMICSGDRVGLDCGGLCSGS